jgi:formylglycine-generating enzyme required for sulfatase activity
MINIKRLASWLGIGVVIAHLFACQIRTTADGVVGEAVVTASEDNPVGQRSPVGADNSAAIWTDPTTSMEFVKAPKGCFMMGNPDYLKFRYQDQGPVHKVCLDEFYIGRYEVTVGEFRNFSEATGYQSEAGKDDFCYIYEGNMWRRTSYKNWRSHNFSQEINEPAVCLSWHDLQAFAAWLSSQPGGRTYRLPTEAEWEYAARAGSDSDRYWLDNPDLACDYANIHDQSYDREMESGEPGHNCDDGYARTAPVGSFTANGFGIYDMLGNVWEWTQDWYARDYYAASPTHNPPGPIYEASGQMPVGRGGSWANTDALYARAFYRVAVLGSSRFTYMGGRLVFSPEGQADSKSTVGE